ncbi:hypothetical protein ANO14919_045300 [Xylariales sp. No.14919]|nr:hypothetical protein ANO14919_045300 [Xylariales sp. No.14919]
MPRILNPGEIAKDVAESAANKYSGETRTGTRATFEAREVTSTSTGTSTLSDWKTRDGTTTIPTQDPATSVSQNGPPWQGGWGSHSGPWPGPWGGFPPTIITRASTVTYTEPPPTAQASQISPLEPNSSETRTDSYNISGPVAAGIGVGASIGLLGICIVVMYLYRKHFRWRKGLSSSVQTSGDAKTNRNTLWPPYPYSASNETPVELSAIRPPKEMSAETRPLEKDASNYSEIAELDGSGRFESRALAGIEVRDS